MDRTEWTQKAVAVLTASIAAGSLDGGMVEEYLAGGPEANVAQSLAALLGGMVNVATTLVLLVCETSGRAADDVLQEIALRAERFGS